MPQRRTARRMTAILTAALLVPALAGCANPIEGLIQGAVEGAVKNSAEGLIGQAVGGDVEMFSTEVPDDFPNLPRPDQDPAQVLRFAGDGGLTWTLTYAVPDESELERITKELVAMGYTEVSNTRAGGMVVSSYQNADYFVMVNSVSDGDAFTLQLIVKEETAE